MTLNEGRGQLNRYKTTQLRSVFHHTKFEKNRSVNVWMQANVGLSCLVCFVVDFEGGDGRGGGGNR